MIKNYKDYDYFEKFGIETQRNNYVKVGIHLITTDYRKGKIGAFNTETYKFDWFMSKQESLSPEVFQWSIMNHIYSCKTTTTHYISLKKINEPI